MKPATKEKLNRLVNRLLSELENNMNFWADNSEDPQDFARQTGQYINVLRKEYQTIVKEDAEENANG